jgi:hypothetical protein
LQQALAQGMGTGEDVTLERDEQIGHQQADSLMEKIGCKAEEQADTV